MTMNEAAVNEVLSGTIIKQMFKNLVYELSFLDGIALTSSVAAGAQFVHSLMSVTVLFVITFVFSPGKRNAEKRHVNSTMTSKRTDQVYACFSRLDRSSWVFLSKLISSTKHGWALKCVVTSTISGPSHGRG
jgi:hypothetical protein